MLLFTLAAPLSLIDDDIIHASPSAESIQIKSLIKGSKVINFTFFFFLHLTERAKTKQQQQNSLTQWRCAILEMFNLESSALGEVL